MFAHEPLDDAPLGRALEAPDSIRKYATKELDRERPRSRGLMAKEVLRGALNSVELKKKNTHKNEKVRNSKVDFLTF